MNKDNVLPVDFDGVFRFTNFTDEDFKAKWANVEYTFPAQKMTPMIIPDATPHQVQHIRKKFAKELAIREFYKTKKFKSLNKHEPGAVPAGYTEEDLAEFTQKCLEPLPVAQAITKILPKADEKIFSKDEEGNPVTQPLDPKKSILQNGSAIVA